MDTSDPEITFNEHGVCSHCQRFDSVFRHRLEAAMRGDLLGELDKKVEELKRKGARRQYDCIIGISGGVDSTYMLLKAVDMGLRPLAVHFDSGWNSELSVNNIENATSKLQVDLKTQVVDWREMRDLQLSFLRAGVPNCDIPTDHAFPAIALKTAVEERAPFVLAGSNIATESVLPRAWGHNASDLRYLRAVHRRHGKVKLKTYPVLGLARKELWYRMIRGVEPIRMLDYLPYDKDAAKRDIADRLDWRDYGGKHHESVFTRWFQGFYLPRRFGFDKRLAHYSSLILSEQMTRAEALERIESEPTYDRVLQQQDSEFIAKKLGIPTEELLGMVDSPLAAVDAYPNNDKIYDLAVRAKRQWRGADSL
jgi:N-acetyl sugar amidotransferase